MRVAVDMHFLQDKAQGIKTFLSCLYKAVAKRDLMHEFVFIFDKEDHVSESWRQHGAVVTLKAKSRAARLTYGIAQAVERAGGVDVCHVNNVVPYGLSCKVLLSVHDVLYRTHPEFFSNGFRFSQQIAAVWSFRRADIIALGSKYTLNQVSRLYPNLLDNMRLLYNGVDVDSYLSLPRDIAKQFIRDKYGLDNFILSVGRIDPRKNHQNMLSAYMRLSNFLSSSSLPKFVVVGEVDNNYLEGRELLRRLVSENAIVWLRGIDDETLRKLYVSSRFVVMASHAEGYGLPIAEGMAAGVPVIAGNNTAMPEVLGPCGLLVNTNDVDDIMCAYKNLIEDNELCMRLGRAGAIRAQGLSWDKSAIRYGEILDELQAVTQ